MSDDVIKTDAVIVGAGPVGLFAVFELGLDHALDPVVLNKGDPGHDIGGLSCHPILGTGQRLTPAPER